MYTKGAKQYQQVNATSEVLESDPHRLIQLLLEAALSRLAQAKGAMDRKDIALKGALLNKVNDILQTLKASLNHSAGGELSERLEALYEYMTIRVLEASSQNSTEMLDEVTGLLLQVKSAWDAIRPEYLGVKPAGSAAAETTA